MHYTCSTGSDITRFYTHKNILICEPTASDTICKKEIEIFDNCGQCFFSGTFHSSCVFFLKFSILQGVSISDENLPTVMGSVIPDPLIQYKCQSFFMALYTVPETY